MSHFAEVVNGIVTRVIVAKQDFIDSQPGDWKQTSYNTFAGKHWKNNLKNTEESDDQSKAFRKNFAGKGDTYDYVFIDSNQIDSPGTKEVTYRMKLSNGSLNKTPDLGNDYLATLEFVIVGEDVN